eukprot:m.161386 g.161386  ORF g.161386 m.161386 type:complete len:759 (-) comp24852_c0_seq1:36-2312(-)
MFAQRAVARLPSRFFISRGFHSRVAIAPYLRTQTGVLSSQSLPSWQRASFVHISQRSLSHTLVLLDNKNDEKDNQEQQIKAQEPVKKVKLELEEVEVEALLDQKASKVEKVVQSLKEKERQKQEKMAQVNEGDTVQAKQAEDHAAAQKKKAEIAPWYFRMHTKAFWADLWKEVKHEAHRYKVGFQLLWTDMRVSSKLLLRVLRGEALNRRERRQFVRTAADVFRLVPFSVFIIVPGMELLLPIALKLFPNMLPSTFEQAATKEAKLKSQLKVKLQMAKFLQDTVEELAVRKKSTAKRSDDEEEEEDVMRQFATFLAEGRTNQKFETKDIVRFSKLFRDELTLDNLPRPQLEAFCRLLSIQPIGTNNFLTFQLRMKLRQLRLDDLLIIKEGVESLSVPELQIACRDRGMRALGLTKESLQQRLQEWLDLHITEGVPTSLLLLSRILYLPENLAPEDQIIAAVERLSDTAKEEARVAILEAEGEVVDPEIKLQLVRAEEERIAEEQAQERAQEEESKRQEEEAKARQAAEKPSDLLHDPAPDASQPIPVMVDVAPNVGSTSAMDKNLAPEVKVVVGTQEKEELMTLEELMDIAMAIMTLSDHEADRKAIRELKEDVQEHKQDVEELVLTSRDALEEDVASKRLGTKLDTMLSAIESSLAKLQTPSRLIDLDGDGVVSTEELLTAMRKVKNPPSEEKLQKIAEVLDADCDGKINLGDLKKIFALVTDEGADLKASNLAVVVTVVEKESLVTGEVDEEKQSK